MFKSQAQDLLQNTVPCASRINIGLLLVVEKDGSDQQLLEHNGEYVMYTLMSIDS